MACPAQLLPVVLLWGASQFWLGALFSGGISAGSLQLTLKTVLIFGFTTNFQQSRISQK